TSTDFASGAWARAVPRNTTPVIAGMRWLDAISATGRSRSSSSASTLSASAPESARSTWYSDPYWRRRSRVSACSTAGSSSTARIAGLATRAPGPLALRAPAEQREQLRLQRRVVGHGYRRLEHAGLLQVFGDRQGALVHEVA